jgi:hypothetical protein
MPFAKANWMFFLNGNENHLFILKGETEKGIA